MFYLIGIILNIFLALLLLLKRNKTYSDKILLAWMTVMAIHQFIFYALYSGMAEHYPDIMGLALPYPVTHGPFLFLYVSSITRSKRIGVWEFIAHFIPFIFLVLLAFPFYKLSSAEKLNVYMTGGKGFEWYEDIQYPVILVVGIGYTIWSLLLIHRHRRNIQSWFSNTEKRNLRWLEYLSIGLGMIWLLVIFFYDEVIFAGVVVLVLFIGFFGINQLPIFYAHPEPPAPSSGPDKNDSPERKHDTDTEVSSPRYVKSGLKEEEAKDLHERLTQLMEKKALYRKNDLTLLDLASELGTHPNYLSQVINEKEQKNFYNYINSLRVKEFIQNASRAENKYYTLLALAFDCGFNSKSTFNKYFKESTGKSPSEYFTA